MKALKKNYQNLVIGFGKGGKTLMNAGLDYQAVRDTVFTHPSMTEAFNDLYSGV